MFRFRQASRSSEAFSYCALLALCTIALVCHFWTSRNTIHKDIQYLHLNDTPPSPSSSIPKIIWYKLGPRGLNNDMQAWSDSCINTNPDYDVQFLTDEDAADFVYSAFSNRPDILAAYFGLTVPTLKADMLRYMLLFDQGGIWADLEISCSDVQISEWIPTQYRDDAAVVVGWEFDVGWAPGITRQFASWMIMARPGSPHMLTVVEDIVDALHDIMKKHRVSIEDVTLAMTGDVVDFSGPRRLTVSVFKSLGHVLNRLVDSDEVAEILQPKLLGDVLVMPGRSFAASVNYYSGKVEGSGLLPPQLVTYHYAGTWKNEQGEEVRQGVGESVTSHDHRTTLE